MRHQRKGLSAVLVVLLLLLLGAPALRAQPSEDARRKFRSGTNVNVPAGETVTHDLYLSGSNIRVDGRIQGDLFAWGGQVDINGPVEGSVFAAGGTVNVRSEVNGDVRVAGGQVQAEGVTRGDLLVGSGQFTLAQAGRVGGDLILGAGRATVDGAVAGAVLGNTGQYNRSGSVTGREEVTLSTPRAEPSTTDRVLDWLRRYLTLLLIGALLLLLRPRFTRTTANMVRERVLMSAGFGGATIAGFIGLWLVIILVLIVAAIVLGLLGFGGLLVAFISGLLLLGAVATYLFVLALVYLAHVIAGYALGRLAFDRTTVEEPTRDWLALVLGVLVVAALTAVPILGTLVSIVVVLVGLGALVLALWRARRPRPPLAPYVDEPQAAMV